MRETAHAGTIIARGDPLIRIASVSKSFRLRRQVVHALRDVSFSIMCGEYLSIMGPSGSGKSTLFNMIGALDTPSGGTVHIGPLNLATLSSRQLAWVRSNYIGYVFQSYNLVPSLTALKNVALASIFNGNDTLRADALARECLERVGLAERLSHRPDEMSGGQQQRVAVARALVNSPAVILADEPTANLDYKTGGDIIALLKQLSERDGVTVIAATHDHKMLSTSTRILWIRDGMVERIGNRADVAIDEGGLDSTHSSAGSLRELLS